MEEEATFEAMRQILPELEARLRASIEQQYSEELRRIQAQYQQQAEYLVKEKQQQLKVEAENNQIQLRKQLSMLQRERQQWLMLEKNYKQNIFELEQKIHQANPGQSVLNELCPSYNSQDSEKTFPKKGGWKKKSSKREQPQVKDEDPILLQQIPSKVEQNRIQTWNGKKKMSGPSPDEFKARGQRQDTMVLSPPKISEEYRMKESVLQPPVLPSARSSTKGSIFWNEDGKKKLLSMIRNIK